MSIKTFRRSPHATPPTSREPVVHLDNYLDRILSHRIARETLHEYSAEHGMVRLTAYPLLYGKLKNTFQFYFF